ncbi:MAG: AMP-binding protein [Proteobacteria bacterium]|nr:AMP-binding protein [Pseudomonadota bacterium]
MPCLPNADFARPEELNAERQTHWQVQRRRLLDSAFYQRHHPGAPVNIPQTIDEIRHSPFTDKSQLRNDQAQYPPFGSYLATSQDSVSRLHRTSGTTGHAMNLALSKNDAEMQAQVAGRAQSAAGLGPGDVVVHCLNYQLWMGGLTDHLGLESTGALVVPFGTGGTDLLIRTILEVGVNAISCTPSYPARLAQVLAERFPDRSPRSLGLKKAFMGGEPGLDDPVFRSRLNDVWGMQAMNSNYGVSDFLCNFAGQCTEQNDLHFMASDIAHAEIVAPDSDTVLPFEAGSEGELVLTHLDRECQPLLRFRTGDLIRLTATDRCRCGRGAPRFRVIGRTDEMVIIRGVNAFPSVVAAAVNTFTELNGEYLIRLKHPPPYDRLPLEVEVADGYEYDDQLREKISTELSASLRLSIDLTLLSPGELGRTEGKTRRLIREYNV